jgi:alkylhydroperoxidase family enzyme
MEARAQDAVAAMPWGDCLVPPGTAAPDLVAEIRRTHGGLVPGWAARFAPVPWLVRTMCEMTSFPFAHLSVRDNSLIALVVSRDNSCRFCYGTQRALMRILGYQLDAIERLERGELVDPDPGGQLGLDFARKISRGTPRPGASECAALERTGRSREFVAELALSAAFTVFANRASTLVALPPEPIERTTYQVAGRLLRPFLLRRTRFGARTRPSSPTPNDGVGADVVAALGASPAAGVLRRAIDAALASPVLPQRTKLLMLAVIARSLACPRSELDARTALAAQGMAADDVARTLDHLGSPALDAREALLVPFARETVRCQPVEIQERLRALSSELGLSREELLEVVGITALANTLCRASVVVEQC